VVAELRVHHGARTDVFSAAEFYDERAGQGEDFVNVVEATYTRILAAPETFTPVRGTR
jgi:hypothetical protein